VFVGVEVGVLVGVSVGVSVGVAVGHSPLQPLSQVPPEENTACELFVHSCPGWVPHSIHATSSMHSSGSTHTQQPFAGVGVGVADGVAGVFVLSRY
jgi:hypothetical protein